jgi:hypothetical protein
MNSKVTYRVEPGGERRSVILVHPIEADASIGRISVLSPVGRALLGRAPGSVVRPAAHFKASGGCDEAGDGDEAWRQPSAGIRALVGRGNRVQLPGE